MPYDYSISMEGLRTAARELDEAARQIANGGRLTQSRQPRNSEADVSSVGEFSDSLSLSGAADFTGALLEGDRAKIAAEANLRFISKQQELERSTLDLIA